MSDSGGRPAVAPRFFRAVPVSLMALLLVLSCWVGGHWSGMTQYALPLPGTGGKLLPAGCFILLFVFQGFLAMALLLSIPRSFSPERKLVFIYIVALSCRIMLMNHEPSDDVNRYLWEGRVLALGVSPYHHAPNDPLLNGVAEGDPFHGGINHPKMTAIYPPLTVVLFSLAGALWYHPLSIKGVLMLFDLGTMIFLGLLLKHRNLDFRWLVLYGLNPVILWAFAGEGHLDAIQCCLLTGAISFFDRRKWGWMFLLAGLSIQAKYVSVLAVFFLLNRENLSRAWIAPLAACLPHVLFSMVFKEDLRGVFASLGEFGGSFAFNGSLHGIFRSLFGQVAPATMLCAVLLVFVLGWGLFYFHPVRKGRYRNDPVTGCFFVLGSLILLAPTVHFWYLTWIIPFLVVNPSRPWLLLCLTISFYFVTRGIYHHTGLWQLPRWAFLCEWLPFYALLSLQGIFFMKQVRSGMETEPPRTLSVVIPARNEASRIASCVGAALRDDAVMEVIVVDGGSRDRTRETALQAGARVVSHDRSLEKGGGRGGQISLGIGAARGDLVAVVHADTVVEKGAFTRMCRVLERQPRLMGGALGCVFESREPGLGLINFANDLRAVFLGVTFGDQVQFFRRKPVASKGLFPPIPLMEDVEFAIRLSALGPQVFLFGSARVSPRRWQVHGFRNAFSIIGRVMLYLLKRMGGTPDTRAMYRRYYGKMESG